MRVISGKYKGRKLKGFDIEGTRPTMDRIKESMFAMIQEKVINSKCLDLFAGSGSLGIEAISNGASKCTFVEKNKIAFDILTQNLNTVEENHYEKAKMDYLDFIKKCKQKYDLIFLDPPYTGTHLNKALLIIKEYDLLEEKGLIICEHTEEIEVPFEILKQKKYGPKKVTILTKSN